MCAHRTRRAIASHPSAAGAIGGRAQAIGSPGAQFDGQSRLGAGEELVEARQLWCAPSARVDEGAAWEQPTHLARVAAKDRCARSSTAKRSGSESTARTWKNDQCGDRSGDRRLASV